MITTSKIRQFSEVLDEMNILVKDMLRVRRYESLFSSDKDKKDSLQASIVCPDDYYNFKCFDTIIYPRYNSRYKKYYIHIESNDYQIFRSREFVNTFIEYFENFNFEFRDLGLNIYVKKEIAFTSVIDIFKKVCIFYLKHNILNETLFEVF